MISGYGSLTKPLPGAQINPAHPLSRGLVGCWLFNEGSGSRANDISGKGNHGALMDMAPNAQNSGWGGSMSGGGLKFDGTSDYINCGSDESLDIVGDITVAAWVKSPDLNEYRAIISDQKNGWPPLTSLRCMFNDSGTIGFTFTVGSYASWEGVTSSNAYDDGEWHHVIAVRNSTHSKIYVDGVCDGYAGYSGIVDSSDDVYIGKNPYSGYSPFNGSIDYVWVYNRALSTAEVMQLYNDPFCNLLSPRRWYVAAAGPSGVIMNQFQKCNIGADLFNGSLQ